MEDFNITLNDKDMLVIGAMLGNSHVQPTNTTTVDLLTSEIESDESITTIPRPTVYRVVRKLLGNGCLKEGSRDGKTKRFYVSLEGAKLYTSLCSLPLEVKEELMEEYIKLRNNVGPQNWHDIYEEITQANTVEEE